MNDDDSSEDDQFIHESNTLNKMMHSWYLFHSTSNQKTRNKFDLEDVLSHDSMNFNEE